MNFQKLSLDRTLTHGSYDLRSFSQFGPWSDIIQEYYQSYDLNCFRKYKDRIIPFLDTYLYEHDECFNLFCYRFQKNIILTDQFQKHKQWYNPLIARKVKDFYLIHPGIDRLSVLKGQGIKEYEFLVLEGHEFDQKYLKEVKQYFTPQTVLEFDRGHFNIASNQDMYFYRFRKINQWFDKK